MAPALFRRGSRERSSIQIADFSAVLAVAIFASTGTTQQTLAQEYLSTVGAALNKTPPATSFTGLDDNKLNENAISTEVQRVPTPDLAVPVTPPQRYMREVLWSEVLGREIPDDTPAFFRDTLVQVVPRTYYLSRDNFDGTTSQAMAGGGWIAYRSGLIGGVLGVQAAFYTSQKISGEPDESGTALLTPGQNPINTLGQALVRARLDGQEFRGGRQLIDTPLINPRDNRMVPQTFEAVTANSTPSKSRAFDYSAGYIWQIKPRDSNDFVPMSEALTNPDAEDEGSPFVMFKYRPFDGLSTIFMDYFIDDYINSGFAQVEFIPPGQKEKFFGWGMGANVIPQQSTGDDLITGDSFSTYQGSAKVQTRFGGLNVFVAGSATGDESEIRSPFGSKPNYTDMQQVSFDRAGEKAIGGALIYDFAWDFERLAGLTVGAWYSSGWDAINPTTGASLADREEFDLWMQYRPTQGPYKGLRTKVQYSDVWQDGNVRDTQPEIRMVVDYTLLFKNQ
ncbi:OprD family outer membrane porin [Hyphomicrobium sp. LHD-15]|uniref:OprD family outer membrane porin n=1 Tax=Hyphomicrobium sp. LHD-15 TaxID=3072142 RepID=UPI00280F2B0C|nr:OprD family outer membrane porin [Hyphomicrobium sp. LHD-15]MDQ8699240.1 OprD family outer membrane porin [Hyphomicrobium sp. LHD-15]